MQHPIDSMMQNTMESIRSMVDVNTVVGAPVIGSAGTTIIPISKVSFGFIAGGGDFAAQDGRVRVSPEGALPFAGGTGAGVSVQPVGFLVVSSDGVRMLPAQTNGAVERVVELLPQLIEEMTEGKAKPQKGSSAVTETFTTEEELPKA